MLTPQRLLPPTLALLLSLGLVGCGDASDDDPDGGGDGGAGSGAEYDVEMLDGRVADYQDFVVDEAEAMIVATSGFTDSVRSGDVEGAKAQFGDSRYHWETIEPLAGLVSTIDAAVDSRVDDFASVDDPTFTGWHRIEHALWEEGKITEETKAFATRLDDDLAPLPDQLDELDMTALDVALGASGLIEEVSEGKLTGEEDRYSHTDLYDIAANVNGSMRAFQVYEPILVRIDKPLELTIEQAFLDAKALLNDYQEPDGSYRSYLELTKPDKQKLQALLAALSEDLAEVPGVLEL